MKFLKICALLCYAISSIPLLVQGQSTTYNVNGEIGSLKEGDTLYLIYQVGDKQITDSAIVKASKFRFQGVLENPVFAAIYLNRNPYVKRLQPGEIMDSMGFYLEPSTIQVKAIDSLKHAIVSGSKTDLLYRQLQDRLKENTNQFDSLNKEADAMTPDEKKDTAVYQGLVRRELQLLEDLYEVHLAFANEHPDAYLSVVSLSQVAAHPTMTQRAAKVYARLSAHLKQTPLGKGIAIQLSATAQTALGKQAPDFELPNPQGKKVLLSDLRGQYVLIDFWASWCRPCRAENPNLVKAYNHWKNKNFNVLGVSLDGPGQKTAWIKAIKDDGLVWTQVSDLKGFENKAAKIYGVSSIPASFLIGPDGKIIGKDLRGEALVAELERLLK
jgi:peroxiredoxin